MVKFKHVLGTALFALALGFTTQDAKAQSAEVTFDSPFMSQYNWRGINVVDGAVWQPSLDVSFGEWSFNFWTNFELTDDSAYTGEGRFTELDSTVTYSGTSNGADWSVGYVHYQFPSVGAAATSEVFGTYSMPMGEWTPTFSAYRDVDQIEGTYFNLAFDQDLGSVSADDASTEINFSWGTSIGYGDEDHNLGYYGNSAAGFTDFSLYGSFSSSVSESFDVYFSFGYVTLVDKDMLAGAPNRSNLVFGVGFSTGF